VAQHDAVSYIEVQKAWMDYLKHVTTLSTGSIVVVATFLDKSKTYAHSFLVVASLAALILSTVALTFSGFGVMASMRTPGEPAEGVRRLTASGFVVGLFAFIVGIICLAVFTIANFV
jgi:hypothetical protein